MLGIIEIALRRPLSRETREGVCQCVHTRTRVHADAQRNVFWLEMLLLCGRAFDLKNTGVMAICHGVFVFLPVLL